MNYISSIFLVSIYLLVASDLQIASCETQQTTYLSRYNRQTGNAGITCELPLHPVSGKWSIINGDGKPGGHVSKNTVLRFDCDPEYKLSSRSSFLICDENWNLSKVPTCERKCPAKYSTSTTTLKCEDKYGNEVTCDEAVDGTYLSYTCAPFFETPIGYKKTILCIDGTWNFPNPICQPVCGKIIEKSTIQLVVGGTIKEQREYPWVIALFQKLGNEFSNICGATLVSQRVVITAAHCVTNDFGDKLRPEEFTVGAGKYYNKFRDPRDVRVQYSEVARIVVKSGYRGAPQRFLADLALLITKDLITINEVVQPVCYQDLPNIHLQAGKIGAIAGWGKTESGEQPDELRTLEIPFKHQTTCAQELPSDWAHRFNTIDKICAGFFNQNKSVCTGDSGSGLYFKNPEDNRYYIHGVVSIAPAEKGDCDPQQNSLYTSVAYYYEFVDRETTKQYVQQCSLPMYPNHGKWVVPKQDRKPSDIVPSNTILKVECDEGYALSSSNAFIDCQSAHAMPQCELLCPKLNLPKGSIYKCNNERGAEIDCTKATDGSSITYSCPEGYRRVPGASKVEFCKKGSWRGHKPECVADDAEKQTTNIEQKKIVCTYASWYAFDKVLPEDLNATLCTHIVYSFAGFLEKGDVKAQNEFFELDRDQTGLFRRFTDLKKKNKDLKVLLSIGRTDGTDTSLFSNMANDESTKATFIQSASSFIETYNFDGMNIEWFYPRDKDKVSYTKLLQDLRKKCNEKGWLLTASVYAILDETGYDGPEMSKVLDFIIIRTYDYYGPWSPYTGQNSALYASQVESSWEKNNLNIEAGVMNWLKLGVSKSKIVLTIAFYGRSFTLKDKNQNGLHAPFTGVGLGDGFLRYSKMCTIKNFNNWTSVWDEEQKSIYSYNEDQWIGHESKDTVRIKAAYAKDNGLLGVNVWPIDGDDIYGKCGTKHILLKHVHIGLGNLSFDDQ
ncbi:uncharacterized protein LOC108909691 [Anoplophora glabripennis]|uniref:uncharacterized protein LOC108909691 n=1 Tax=Anoplophora glabripennis TaxID=217634 RepID=UPI0008750986|nr:uncharacterized protein LOC108909691 [Anoplophora glabripennis]